MLVEEDEIAAGMVFALRTHRLIAEGGGAVALAAALAGKLPALSGPLAIVISGSNVAPATILTLPAYTN